MTETDPDAGTESVDDSSVEAAGPETETHRKKKHKVSRQLRDFHRLERGFSRGAHRLSRAVAKGLGVYRRRRDRSAEKKRDGALRDLPVNAAEGLATTMRLASRVPVDLARAVDNRTTRRIVRLGSRILLWPIRR